MLIESPKEDGEAQKGVYKAYVCVFQALNQKLSSLTSPVVFSKCPDSLSIALNPSTMNDHSWQCR